MFELLGSSLDGYPLSSIFLSQLTVQLVGAICDCWVIQFIENLLVGAVQRCFHRLLICLIFNSIQ